MKSSAPTLHRAKYLTPRHDRDEKKNARRPAGRLTPRRPISVRFRWDMVHPYFDKTTRSLCAAAHHLLGPEISPIYFCQTGRSDFGAGPPLEKRRGKARRSCWRLEAVRAARQLLGAPGNIERSCSVPSGPWATCCADLQETIVRKCYDTANHHAMRRAN